MRTLLRGSIVLALAVTGLPAMTSTANALAVIEERVYVETTVDSDHDGKRDRVAIDIARTSGATNLPVVFEHSPYRDGLNDYPNHNVNVDRLPQENIFGAASYGPDIDFARPVPDLPGWYDDYFLPRGYAVVLGHSIGTGGSEGCPTSGDMQETLGATAVIDWLNGRAKGYNASGALVTASWSNGNVGMLGISYNGTLPNMAAATGVAGLKAIVPISAITNWYDYYRANGLVVAPGGYQGEDADVLANAVVTRTGCADEMAALTTAQDRTTGDYTQFWRDRDYLKDVGNVTAATFVIHGQADWNVKGMHYAQWYEALRLRNAPRKIWLHKDGHGTASRSDYQSTVGRWFDRYVKGINNGIDTEPKADVQYPDGTWKTYSDWPDPTKQNAVFNLGATSATAPGLLSLSPTTGNVNQSFVDQGRTMTASQLSASPDSANANRLIYRTAALTTSLRLSGVPRVKLRAAVDNRNDANLTAVLVDYNGTTPTIITRGWMDPQNRNSVSAGERLVQGQEYDMTFTMQPRDYVFAAGRRIGLIVISTDYDYTLRPLGGTQLHLNPALSSLTLPLVGLPTGNDYAISIAPPASGSVNPGSSVSTTVNTSTLSGSAQTINLTATGLPSGATATFNPASVTSGNSSTLTIATTASTTPGTYTVTVVASAPSGTKTATYVLTVNGTSTGCPGYESNYTGTLASGGSAYQPNGSYFQAPAGAHRACLDGPNGTDFDLYLQKWNGSAWANVASATSSNPDETLTYNGAAGYYRYRILAYSGSGSYSLGYDAP